MDRVKFNLITRDYPAGSVKKACYIFREYMKCEYCGHLELCAVTSAEYHKALNILLAFAYKNSSDNIFAEQW